MELTTLKYFYETARLGGLTRASEKLKISPSAISRQIGLLEEEVGKPLFNKSKYGYALNSAGAAFYKRTEQILKLCTEAVEEAGGKPYEISEPLSVGFMDDAFNGNAPELLENFKALNKGVSIVLHGGRRKNLFDMLQNNKLDIAFLYFYKTPANLEYIDTGIEKRFGLMMRKDDPLAERDSIDEKILGSLPLIIPQTDDLNPDRSKTLPYDPGDPNILAQADSPPTFFSLVTSGMGYIYGIEPMHGDPLYVPLVFRPISSSATVKLYIVRAPRPVHQESSDAFMKYAEDYFKSEER